MSTYFLTKNLEIAPPHPHQLCVSLRRPNTHSKSHTKFHIIAKVKSANFLKATTAHLSKE